MQALGQKHTMRASRLAGRSRRCCAVVAAATAVRTVKIGTRGSPLALAQAYLTRDLLKVGRDPTGSGPTSQHWGRHMEQPCSRERNSSLQFDAGMLNRRLFAQTLHRSKPSPSCARTVLLRSTSSRCAAVACTIALHAPAGGCTKSHATLDPLLVCADHRRQGAEPAPGRHRWQGSIHQGD